MDKDALRRIRYSFWVRSHPQNFCIPLSSLDFHSICFDKKIIRSSTEVLCTLSSFLSYWADLQKGGDKEAMEDIAETIKTAALHFHPHEAPAEDTGMVLLH
ncbi:hypothetical protein HU200_021206 [Digitaria exilis]|uniref:Uncharacterized protein n=1 Tax=Digitaria exilis TaxID=1010633 RepID=A0A835EZZ8_9POAL|nr:hypothetical protein HU200_021206 [Digitaria exilis]